MAAKVVARFAARGLVLGMLAGVVPATSATALHDGSSEHEHHDASGQILAYLLSERFPADISLAGRPAYCPDDPVGYILSSCALHVDWSTADV